MSAMVVAAAPGDRAARRTRPTSATRVTPGFYRCSIDRRKHKTITAWVSLILVGVVPGKLLRDRPGGCHAAPFLAVSRGRSAFPAGRRSADGGTSEQRPRRRQLRRPLPPDRRHAIALRHADPHQPRVGGAEVAVQR